MGLDETLTKLKKNNITPIKRLPFWLKRPIAHSGKHHFIYNEIANNGLHTVCQEARCPNRSECFSRGTATFLILGDSCTRHCSFCSINHSTPRAPDPQEPSKLVKVAKKMQLRHVVITSVTRDDLSDGGASVFADIVNQLRRELPNATIELLIPDFKGDKEALDIIIRSHPDILNHNVETIPAFYPIIRPEAIYDRSLELLQYASSKQLITKSGIMVGLGEKTSEVLDVLIDLRRNGCKIITIGQYLQPSPEQIPVKEYIEPEVFKMYQNEGTKMGFDAVYSGPFIRSSYRADEYFSVK